MYGFVFFCQFMVVQCYNFNFRVLSSVSARTLRLVFQINHLQTELIWCSETAKSSIERHLRERARLVCFSGHSAEKEDRIGEKNLH